MLFPIRFKDATAVDSVIRRIPTHFFAEPFLFLKDSFLSSNRGPKHVDVELAGVVGCEFW